MPPTHVIPSNCPLLIVIHHMIHQPILIIRAGPVKICRGGFLWSNMGLVPSFGHMPSPKQNQLFCHEDMGKIEWPWWEMDQTHSPAQPSLLTKKHPQALINHAALPSVRRSTPPIEVDRAFQEPPPPQCGGKRNQLALFVEVVSPPRSQTEVSTGSVRVSLGNTSY